MLEKERVEQLEIYQDKSTVLSINMLGIILTNIILKQAVCDGTQNVKRYRYFFPVPNIFDTYTSSFCSLPNFSDTGSETFFRYQILPIPVPRLFPVPNFSDTGSDTTRKYEKFPVPIPVPIKNLQTF